MVDIHHVWSRHGFFHTTDRARPGGDHTDEHDEGAPSDLARPGAFRLNIGVGRETFERLVGSMDAPDYAAYGRFLPHPVYAKQRWIAILNPSDTTFRDVVLPLIAEAHDRLGSQQARHRTEREGPAA